MDLKDSVVNGGVLIVHQTHDGKHHYEVENVVKYKKESGKKMFVRRGDKLLEINGINVQELTPEELAQKLSEKSPVLTMYNSCRKLKDAEQAVPQEDALHPVSKELTMMSFCWEMMREEEEEENKVPQELEEGGTNGDEDNVCQESEDGGGSETLLVIEMTKTSISLLRGRGCDTQNPCEGCHGAGCAINDIVVVAESSMVTLVPRGSGSISFRQQKLSEALIKHELSHRYLRGICSEKVLCSSPNPG
ncbi:interleukin-1 family member A [Xenentodon cancila]